MARRKSSAEKQEKKTPVKLRPITRKHAGKVTEPWAIMERLIAECDCLAHLKLAKIRLWWQKDWKPDVDNIATGAQVCKASEIDRNLVEEGGGESVDVFIKLPEAQWPTLDATEKEHRLFHELCHVKPAKDSNGKQKRDAKDRLLWRLGRHPIAAFFEEVERYGVDRILGHNAKIIESIAHAERPMEKLWDEAEEAHSKKSEAAGDWKDLPLEAAGIVDADAGRLLASDIKTLGDLQTVLNEGRTIASVSAAKLKKIRLRFSTFLTSREKQAATKDADGDAWKQYTLAAAGFKAKQIEAMESADIRTLGELQAAMTRHGQWWAKNTGVSARLRLAIEDTFNAYLMKHATTEKKAA